MLIIYDECLEIITIYEKNKTKYEINPKLIVSFDGSTSRITRDIDVMALHSLVMLHHVGRCMKIVWWHYATR